MMFLGESFLSSSQRPRRPLAGRGRVHGLDGVRDRASAMAGGASRLRAHARGGHAQPGRPRSAPTRSATRRDCSTRPGVVAILSDEGYPQPPIPAEEFASTIGVTVHRVTRLEPWILQHRDGSFDDLVSGVENEATEAAADPNCVAYKSIVAYRTGLDVGDPSSSDARGGVRAMARRRRGRRRGSTRSRSATS